jgi:hypothetical protein
MTKTFSSLTASDQQVPTTQVVQPRHPLKTQDRVGATVQILDIPDVKTPHKVNQTCFYCMQAAHI